MHIDFTGKVALVAGASRGIGAVTAGAFARAGAAVVLAARSEAALGDVAERIRRSGGETLAVPTDLTHVSAARRLIETALDRYGRLDAAFNNATAGPEPKPLTDMSPSEFSDGLAGNATATFLGLKFQIPAMLRNDGGAIVNMASVAGLTGTANLAAYVTGKAGVIALSRVAALEYADRGVRVNVVAPGPILTHHLEAAGAEAQRQAAMATPMGRVGRAWEVADVVLWLCSEHSSFVTGAVIPIDGGQSAGFKPPHMYPPGKPMESAHEVV